MPGETDYIQPTLRADRSWLHLETRYAYEDRNSLSIFAGTNVGFGKDVRLVVTPMFGALVGDLAGFIPALELSFTAWRFDAYAETEYVFDANDPSLRFFYMWSELGLRPVRWGRVGLVTQRTRVYRSDLDTQHGLLLGAAFSRVRATFYMFDAGGDDQLALLSIGVAF